MLLPLHAFALQGNWFSSGNASNFAHEMEHAQGESHHHESDGSVHYDESDESSQHAADHSCFQQMAALPSMSVPSLPLPIASEIIASTGLDLRDGFPDRPQRPPSALG